MSPAPDPLPGFTILYAPELDLDVELTNVDYPQVTQERAGGFRAIPVPQLRPLIGWDGHPEITMRITGMLDGWTIGGAGTVEGSLDRLRRLGSKVSTDVRRPPLIRLIGDTPNPTRGSDADWVIQGLEIVNDIYLEGQVARALCTVELLQWTTSEIVERKEAKERSATRIYVWKKNDTLSGVAKRLLGSASKHTLIRTANPKIKHWSKVDAGDRIRVPGAPK